MPVHLPPLQTLRAFEAAARHLSYSRAAEELRLTHSAISHHIKTLEDYVGCRLFRRVGRRMELTRAGHELLLKIRQGLRLLERAFDTPPAGTTTLVVSTLSAFALCWLVRRLPGFQALRADIDIDLRISTDLARLAGGQQEGVDIAIRYGPGGWPGLQQDKLMDEQVFPVCSPGYRGGKLPARPEDLAGTVLLRVPAQPWEPWFDAAGVNLSEPVRGPIFSDTALVLAAAAEGQGVALARSSLVADDLRGGRLARLFDVAITDTYAYYMVWRTDNPKLHIIEEFRVWLQGEAARTATAEGA